MAYIMLIIFAIPALAPLGVATATVCMSPMAGIDANNSHILSGKVLCQVTDTRQTIGEISMCCQPIFQPRKLMESDEPSRLTRIFQFLKLTSLRI